MGVLVISFGSQYAGLIAKSIRKAEVFSKIIDWNSEKLEESLKEFEAIILSGGPDSVKDGKHDEIVKRILKTNKPIMGICYGMQLIHKILGGEIDYGNYSEFGSSKIKITRDHPIVDGVPRQFETWMSHNDSVKELAPGFLEISKTNEIYNIASCDKRKIYTVQFHPEVEHCEAGERIILNFLFLICNLQKSWKIQNVADQKINELRDKIGRNPVLLALSGGVDSAVVAKLLQKAAANLSLIYIDTGLMRKHQGNLIINYFKGEFKNKLKIIDKSEEFIEAIKGVEDPEEKRKIIGKKFEEVFSEQLQNIDDIKFLAQGTIKSDLVESGKKHKSNTIKTHHNTIESLKEKFTLIEPLSDLFKSEVRHLGKTLDLPDFVIQEKPFPGPGYAVRISGEVTKEKLRIIKEVDQIFIKKLKESGFYYTGSQDLAILLNSKSTGISGDQRRFGYAVVLRSIKSRDFMTAEIVEWPWSFLQEVSNEIINKIPEVTRVLYDLTSKPPATIEWE